MLAEQKPTKKQAAISLPKLPFCSAQGQAHFSAETVDGESSRHRPKNEPDPGQHLIIAIERRRGKRRIIKALGQSEIKNAYPHCAPTGG